MITGNTFPVGINPQGDGEGFKRFTVLYMEGSHFKREKAEGKVVRAAKSEVEIATRYPLEAKQVVYWIDTHKQNNFHFAMVRWVEEADEGYRVGLSLL